MHSPYLRSAERGAQFIDSKMQIWDETDARKDFRVEGSSSRNAASTLGHYLQHKETHHHKS